MPEIIIQQNEGTTKQEWNDRLFGMNCVSESDDICEESAKTC